MEYHQSGCSVVRQRFLAFPGLSRKALRVVQYRGNSRVETIREQHGVRGYAPGYGGAIRFLTDLLPTNEVIGQAIRAAVPLCPELAIRELVANALIHQDSPSAVPVQ